MFVVGIAALVFAIVIVASALHANGAYATTGAAATVTVRTTLTDSRVVIRTASVAAGRVRFVVHNSGRAGHELVVVATATPAPALPVNAKTQRAYENSRGSVRVDAIRRIGAGSTKRGTFQLAPGHYLLICDVAGHYAAGMTVDFTVT